MAPGDGIQESCEQPLDIGPDDATGAGWVTVEGGMAHGHHTSSGRILIIQAAHDGQPLGLGQVEPQPKMQVSTLL